MTLILKMRKQAQSSKETCRNSSQAIWTESPCPYD